MHRKYFIKKSCKIVKYFLTRVRTLLDMSFVTVMILTTRGQNITILGVRGGTIAKSIF